VDPSTLPAEGYKTLALRVGQSTEANNTANRDQDFTLEVSSGSRTATIPASSLHRLLYPDPPPFGPAKIVMQTLRLPVERLVESGVDPIDLRSIALVFDRRATGTADSSGHPMARLACAGFGCQFQNFPGSIFATSGLSRSAM
jgi:hypothetical protein